MPKDITFIIKSDIIPLYVFVFLNELFRKILFFLLIHFVHKWFLPNNSTIVTNFFQGRTYHLGYVFFSVVIKSSSTRFDTLNAGSFFVLLGIFPLMRVSYPTLL